MSKTFLLTILALLIIGLWLPQIALSENLRYYITGDPAEVELIGDPTPDPEIESEEQAKMQLIGEQLWLGVSVGLDIVVIDLKERSYKIGLVPGIGYGLKWRPDWWTLTDSFLGLDLFVEFSFQDYANSGKFDSFLIDLLPIVNIFDWLSVGAGVRWIISLDPDIVKDDYRGIISFGIKTSI